MKKILGNLYIGFGMAMIFTIIILGWKIIGGMIAILCGLLLINKGMKTMGAPIMQQRVKAKVMKQMNPFKF